MRKNKSPAGKGTITVSINKQGRSVTITLPVVPLLLLPFLFPVVDLC